MNDNNRPTGATQGMKAPQHIVDILLVAGFALAFAGFFGVYSVVAYISGLQREPSWVLGVLLVLLAAVLILSGSALVVRMLRRRRHARDSLRIRIMNHGIILGVVACFVLPFTRFRPPAYMAFTAGLRQYAAASGDVTEVRVWLSGFTPEQCTGEWTDTSDWPYTEELPEPVGSLGLSHVQLSLDGSGRPMVRFARRAVLLGDWGIVVGDQEMEIPPPGPFGGREYRLPFAPGAYVWHEIH